MRQVRRLLREESGFTLAELLVTMLMMLLVMSALYSIFDMSLRVFSFGNDKTEAVENARVGLERMERELRGAYPYGRSTGNLTLFPAFTTNPSSSITFGNDLDADHQIQLDTSTEQIAYSLSGDEVLRNGQPLVEFVQPGGLTFTYCKTPTSCPSTISESEIKMVRIDIAVSVDRGTGNPATQTLSTDVALRNRGG
jgi:prepilin-type N-terminal cleavage/methylation domain-containing protein